MTALMKLGWGGDDPTFRQIFTSQLIPTATRQQADAFNELQRKSASPECAVRYYETVGNFDIRSLLPRVATPTLVIHVRDDLMGGGSPGTLDQRGLQERNIAGLIDLQQPELRYRPWPQPAIPLSGSAAVRRHLHPTSIAGHRARGATRPRVRPVAPNARCRSRRGSVSGASDTKRLGNALGAAGHLRQRPCSSRIN